MSSSQTPRRPPTVAIVGAPNVGKSTLFNRLTGRRRALVTHRPGVTRDRLYGEVRTPRGAFRLVDTGGMVPGSEDALARAVEAQARAAMEEADAILFVVDARAGCSRLEHDLAQELRKWGKPLVLVANKVDGPKQDLLVPALSELGLGEAWPVSAEHGGGVDALVEHVETLLDLQGATSFGEEDGAAGRDAEIRVAVVGRPNVGKSSLVNRLVGEDRVTVSPEAGTTRDAVDTLLEWRGARFRLVDTAGLRRRGRVRDRLESLSVVMAERSMDRADVVVLVLDATEPLAAQDTHIAGLAHEKGRPVVVAVNKWDRVAQREEAARQWDAQVTERLRFLKEAPRVFVSARTGQRVHRILEEAGRLNEAAGRRVPTPQLNRWLQAVAGPQLRPPPGRKVLRLYYAAQVGTRPPRFVLFCNDPSLVHFSFARRLENSLREQFGFGGVPVLLQFRRRRGESDRRRRRGAP